MQLHKPRHFIPVPNRKTNMLKLTRTALCLGLLYAAAAQASTTHIDFNSDPTALGITVNPSANWQADHGRSWDAVTNANDGFLELNAAVNSLSGYVVFPDFDNGAFIQGFVFDCYVRVGNGSGTPADGFSISYARSPLPNPILYNSSTPGNSDAEEGTRTGIALGFDAYNNGTTPPDPVALDVWVDGVQIFQYPFTTQNGAVTDTTSLQTGPLDPANPGSPYSLGWAHVVVELTTNGLLNVFYKEKQVLTNFDAHFSPGPGQLVMAGRTGGLNENQDVDDITITTTVATGVTVGAATGIQDGVQVTFFDSGPAVLDTTVPVTVSINGGPTVPATAVDKNATTTTIRYMSYPPLLPGSTNTVVVTVTDTLGRVTTTPSLNFVVAAYATLNSATAVTNVTTTTPGFRMKTWQSSFEYNINWWAMEQLSGLHGTNQADLSLATDNGFFDLITAPSLGGPTNLINMDYTNLTTGVLNEDGDFVASGGFEEMPWPGLTSGGNGLHDIDHSAADVLCFLKFSTPGVYTMGVSSDDGFRVTTGPNPADWGATIVGEFNGGKGASDVPFTFVVTNAGIYPFRLVWENGTGGANCEWFSIVPAAGVAGTSAARTLVNDPDPTNTTGVVAYYAGPRLPAYVSWEYPTPGSTIGDPIMVKASITDAGTTVTPGSILLSVDGTALTPLTTQVAAGVTTVTGYRTSALAGGAHTAKLVYTTTGTGGGTFSNTWTYTVPASYAVLNAAWAVTGVDTNQQGIHIRTWQSTGGSPATQPNNTQWTQEQLAGLHGDNNVDTTLFPTQIYSQGYTNWTDIVNFDIGTADGVFQSYDDYPEIPFPGLPSTAGLNGDSSLEGLCYLYLDHPGLYTMGVNSDDGFRVTAGASPADWLASTVVGEVSAGRGTANTIQTTFSFLVTNAGFYPFRLMWENGDGESGNGANLEWYMVGPAGSPALINDPRTAGEFGTAKAYYSGPLNPAFISAVQPYPGTGPVRPDAQFLVKLTDGGTTVSSSSVKVYINGKQLSGASVTKSGLVTSVTMPTGYLLPGDNINLLGANTLYSYDTAAVVYTTGAGTFSNSWSFTVYPWGGLDPAWNATTVDTSKPGFKVRPWHSTGEQNASQANTIRWTEEQMVGAHGSNHADLSQATDGGYIDFGGADLAHTINFDLVGSHDGNFQPNGTATAGPGYADNPWPGSSNATSWDNSSEEFITYLSFNSPGLYQMGISSDDGFKVTVGPNPKDWINSTVCGYYNGGKGASDVTFFMNVTNAGTYPVRLLWENGGGGCNCEWFSVDPSGTRYLINDPDSTNSTGIKAYYSGPQLPAYVSEFWPADGATGVQDGWVSLTLQDGSTTVVQSSIVVKINGVAVTPVIVTSGGTTKIYTPTAFPAGTYTAAVTYSTSDGGSHTATWSFTTTGYQWWVATLSTNLWTPPGSGTNAGFAMEIFQTQNTNIFNGWANITRMADMALQGLYGPTVADLTDYTNKGAMWWPGVINFSQTSAGARSDNGAFQTADGYTDATVPGLPGIGMTVMDNDAYQARMFLEFPTAGPYTMGFNSDDGFRLTTGDQGSPGRSPLAILAPASVAGEITSMYTTTADEGGNNGFGATPPSTVPIIGRVVLANPIDASTALVNASALKGNIAFIQRGVTAFTAKYDAARDAGAVAVIIGNNSANDTPANEYPGTMAGTDATNTIPVLWVNYAIGTNLMADATADTSSPLIARITAQDCSTICGKYDNGRGVSTDGTQFTIQVPAPGVYPFRLIWENGGGDANSEFYTIDPATGIRTLINDAACPVKSWITRNVHAAGALPAPVLKAPTLDASGNVIISWTGEGELWEAYSLSGPWFKSTYQSNPSAVVSNPLVPEQFFRVRQY
jgi:hypothetical protein